jgi:hypothetical protein
MMNFRRLLMPPGRDLFSTTSPLKSLVTHRYHVFEGTLEDEGPCELTQNSGEILVVPRHWSHQVFNYI